MIPRFATSGTMPVSAFSRRSLLAIGFLNVLRQHCRRAAPRREPLQRPCSVCDGGRLYRNTDPHTLLPSAV
jgi:hypothetical protein